MSISQESNSTEIIGVVGGMGPMAGIELTKSIVRNTRAQRDQEHVPVVLISRSQTIPDRTEFLNRGGINPAEPIADIVGDLAGLGARYIGIPCNTSHAPAIFGPLLDAVRRLPDPPDVVNMIAATRDHIKATFPDIGRIGLLATDGTVCSRLYHDILSDWNVIAPDPVDQHSVHRAIYDRDFGIKSYSDPVQVVARDLLLAVADRLVSVHKAEVVIMGCTEIPLALNSHIGRLGAPGIDPGDCLARELIRRAAPDRLTSFPGAA